MKTNKINKTKKSFNRSIIYHLSSIIYLILPSLAFAFPTNVKDFVDNYFFKTFSILTPILVGIAFLLFFWGVAKFILAAGNEKELVTGKKFMIWGVLALFILTSFWAIMTFLSNQFGFSTCNGQACFHLLPNDVGEGKVITP